MPLIIHTEEISNHDVLVCPWCLGLTEASGEEITICQCCNNPIREEDVTNDEED